MPLRRTESLRDSYARKLKERGQHVVYPHWGKNAGKGIKKTHGLKKVSRSHREKLKVYFPIANDFLARPENRYCYLCIGRSLDATLEEIKQIMTGTDPIKLLLNSNAAISSATEVHHKFGRTGRKLLCDERGFIPSCRACREWPHGIGTSIARRLGLLASAVDYNSHAALERHCAKQAGQQQDQEDRHEADKHDPNRLRNRPPHVRHEGKYSPDDDSEDRYPDEEIDQAANSKGGSGKASHASESSLTAA